MVCQVAIVSQENSAMYVSYFDWEKMDFAPEKGETIFNFPRSTDCEVRPGLWCLVGMIPEASTCARQSLVLL
jgi:hypothetical protein